MILDEAPAIGRIPILAESIAYLPGFNVRILLVVQAISQLRDVYGAQTAETMMKSLAARIAYAPKDFAEANELSQELGNMTVPAKTISKPMFDGFDRHGRRSRNVSISEQKRPLLLPQEIKELGRERAITIYEGLRPVLAKKNRYFQDPRLRKRLMPPPSIAMPNAERICVAAKGTVEESALAVESAFEQAVQQFQPVPDTRPCIREATLQDMDRIDELTLDDFAVDWSSLEIPQPAAGERLTSDELSRFAHNFLETMREY